jgi:hypothetical protein
MSERAPFHRNPVPKEDETRLDKVIIQVKDRQPQPPVKGNGQRKPSEEKTNVSPRIVELRQQLAEREKTRDLEARRKKLQRIVGGTVTAIAAAAGITLFVSRNSEGKNDDSKGTPSSLVAKQAGTENSPPAPEPTVMVTTAPTSLATAEPADPTDPEIASAEENGTAPEASATSSAATAAKPPYPYKRNDSFYDEIENESIYDSIDRKYPSKKPATQPKAKNSGTIIRKAPF